MKTNIILSAIIGLFLTLNIAQAQNYKAPKIDASGKITDKDGKHLGTVSKEGAIADAAGTKVAYVDSEGSLVDSKTGKKLGKVEKNGNLVSYFPASSGEGWTTNAPMNGTCLVKDKDGKVVAEVHENYKEFGACAIHCLSHHMDHHKMTEKTTGVTYVCPMHPEVTSDKPGKCSKCGMNLVKK